MYYRASHLRVHCHLYVPILGVPLQYSYHPYSSSNWPTIIYITPTIVDPNVRFNLIDLTDLTMGFPTINAVSFNYFTNDLLRLPRELRDLIYSEFASSWDIYDMDDTKLLPDITNPQLRHELLETFFSIATCSIRHTNFLPILNQFCEEEDGWTCPQPGTI
ncbi:hypothetical protein J1614_001250 [Plenodomus biglobosus]|nr:hypothetical protein J1614_001250 [Plenodomus biglobosus]